LTFDVPSNKTVDVKGAKTIMIKTSGNEKMCYTVILACCADATKPFTSSDARSHDLEANFTIS